MAHSPYTPHSASLSLACASAALIPATTDGPFSIELRRITFALPSGKVLWHALNHRFHTLRTGLVGRNGSGKSLLLRVLLSEFPPQSGSVLRHGSLFYVPQDIAAATDQSVKQTVADLAGVSPVLRALARIEQGCPTDQDFEQAEGQWLIRDTLQRALNSCGLDALRPDDSIERLSGGELTRVALVGAFLSGAQGLLLDEPTNHLDAQARAWLRDRLSQWRGGAIIVSHDRALLDEMDEIVALERGTLHRHTGNYSSYLDHRSRQMAAAQAALAHARTERDAKHRHMQHLHDAQQHRGAQQNRQGKTANQAAISLDRAKHNAQMHAGREHLRLKAAHTALESAVRVAAAQVAAPPAIGVALPDTTVAPGSRVLHLDQVVAPFGTAFGPAGLPSQALSFTLNGPFRLVIQGPNGCGKSTLLKLLAGIIQPVQGECVVGVPCAWLDQHATALYAGASLLQQLHALGTPLPEGVLRSYLALLGLGAEQVNADVRDLSGGERIKAALACALWRARPAQLLLLDEPTNHLDLDSVVALEQALATYPGALVVVSHDAHFLNALRPTHRLSGKVCGWTLEEQTA